MPDSYGSALATLDFHNLIGGPLCAVVDAQSQASMTTLAFLSDPRIATKDGMIRNVVFKYKKSQPQGEDEDAELQVPILTILPIPFLRVKQTTIKFHAKITGTYTRDTDTTDSGTVTVEDDMNVAMSSGNMHVYGKNLDTKATFSHTSTTKEGFKEEREYSMDIEVIAVQDAMPTGLERVLTLLENCIKEKPAKKK